MSFEKELEAAAQEYAGCVSLADLGIEDGSFADRKAAFLAGASHIQAQRDAERKEIERQILDVCYFIDKKEMSETTIAVRNTLAHIIHELKRKGAGE
jgi:thioredoxin-like negative regulator of GroEL